METADSLHLPLRGTAERRRRRIGTGSSLEKWMSPEVIQGEEDRLFLRFTSYQHHCSAMRRETKKGRRQNDASTALSESLLGRRSRGCSHKVGLMWKKWLSLHFHDDSGYERERLEPERESGKRPEENREKVAPREVKKQRIGQGWAPNSERDEKGFSQYNFFSSSRFLLLLPKLPIVRCLSAYVISQLPLLFCIWSPLGHFLLIVNGKQDV